MKPYYSAGGVEIYHGDARDVLPGLALDSVDLIVADPPYGVAWQSRRRVASPLLEPLANDEAGFDARELIGPALRTLRRGRHLYIFGAPDLGGLDLSAAVELVWDKGLMGAGDLSLPWAPAHETIGFYVYVKSRINVERGDGKLAAKLRRGSVIRCQRPNSGQVGQHPTEKPVLLLRQLIESSSVIGETVLDPCMGSGSTLEAAQLEGRRAIGIEIEERYCEVAARRLGQQVMALEFA